MSSEKFGLQLRALRKQAGLNQAELAEALTNQTKPFRPTDKRVMGFRLISNWERDVSVPTRPYFLALCHLFIAQLTPRTARQWAKQASYFLSEVEIKSLFPQAEGAIPTEESHIPPDLPPLPQQPLFGIELPLATLQTALSQDYWLFAIEGIGGIGKTTLARVVIEAVLTNFTDTIWLHGKQEEFRPFAGVQATDYPALNQTTLVNQLLSYLQPQATLNCSPHEKMVQAKQQLKTHPYLIVIDNLETVVDYTVLMPLIQQLTNPTKFLLTSRQGLHSYSEVYRYKLPELPAEAAFGLLRAIGDHQQIPALATAPDEILATIYEVVGGNPLALKLVAGQITMLSLPQVLTNLRHGKGQTIEQFYDYIYQTVWEALTEPARQLLTIMPMTNSGDYEDLQRSSGLDDATLATALQHLITLSLIDVQGDLLRRRYTIHQLTNTFLIEEIFRQ